LKKVKAKSITNKIKIGAIIALILAAVVLSGCVDQSSPKSSAGSPQTTVKPNAPAGGPAPLVVKSPPPPLKIPGSITPTPTVSKATATKTAPKAAANSQPTAAPASITSSGLEELLIKQSDVPEFPLKNYNFMATSAGGPQLYKDKLPAGMQNIGQTSEWGDIKNYGLSSQITMLDFTGDFANIPAMAKNCDQRGTGECGSAGIGDTSYFMDLGSDATGIWKTGVQFTKGTYCVTIMVVTDNRQASHDKAFYVAKQVLSRMK
jgi:hypothetical protein